MFRCDICEKLEVDDYGSALWCEYCEEEYYACNVCSVLNTFSGRIAIHQSIKHKSVDLV